VRVAEVSEIRLHAERYSLPEETALQVSHALREGRRVVAVAHYSPVLEHCARISGSRPIPAPRTSSSPEFRLTVVKGLLTNFHLPINPADVGKRVCREREHTRCISSRGRSRLSLLLYGDCMFIA